MIAKYEKTFLWVLLCFSAVLLFFINIYIFAAENPIEIDMSHTIATATDQASGYEAANLTDGNKNTIWHTAWEPVVSKLPQSLIFAFETEIKLFEVHVLPRQDMENGRILKYNFYIMQPDGNYKKVVSNGKWDYKNLDYKKVEISKSEKAKGFKLEIIEGIGGFGSAADVKIMGIETGKALQKPLKVKTVSATADEAEAGYEAENVIDGDISTMWHTEWDKGINPMPHYVDIDLGGKYTVLGIKVLRRQEGSNGDISKYNFYAGESRYKLENLLNSAKWFDRSERNYWYDIPAKYPLKTSYIRIEALKGQNNFAAIAEISILTEEIGVITPFDAFGDIKGDK